MFLSDHIAFHYKIFGERDEVFFDNLRDFVRQSLKLFIISINFLYGGLESDLVHFSECLNFFLRNIFLIVDEARRWVDSILKLTGRLANTGSICTNHCVAILIGRQGSAL